VRRACSLVPHTILPGLLARASCNLACSPSLLARASCKLAGSAHPCEFTSLLRKFAEPTRLCLIQSCRVCSPVRVYFSASQVRRAYTLVPHTILPGLLTRASLLFRFASSPSLLARVSCNLVGTAHPCEFTFVFASSPSLLARASCNLAGSAHPCEFTSLLRKFAEPTRLCLIQSCRVCAPVRIYFSASQVRRVCSPVPLATLPGLLTRASLLFCFAGTPSLLACASYNLAGSAHPCEFTFLLPKFAESARPCLLQPCLACSPERVYFSASQVRRACSLVPHTILPGLRTRANLLFCFPSSPSLLARASCNLAWPAHPSEFTFLLRRYAEPARLCLIQSCRVCAPVRIYFSASQVRRVCSPVPLATLPGLLTRASLLFCFAGTPSLLACASYNLAGSAHPCEFTFLLPKFAESARPCLLQPCLACSPERVYFSASQVRRACSLVPHTILPGLRTRANLLFCFPSSPSLLARASCNLAWPAHPSEFTFLLRRYAEPARLCLIQSCRVCAPVRIYFSASQVRRVCSPVPLATLPGLLTRASLLFCFAGTPSLLACASYNLAGSAHPCEFTFLLPKFAESARPCLLQPCLACSPERVYFSASQIRRDCSLVPHTILPGLLTRASLLFCFEISPSQHQVPHTILLGLLTRASLLFCFACSPSLLACASYNLAGSAHPCEFTFLLPKFAEFARPCLLQPCLVCSLVQFFFSASQVRRACSLVPLATLPDLLTCASLLFRFASSPSLLALAYCNLVGFAHLCEFTFPIRKFAEPARLCLIQSCRVCAPVRVYFSASQVRRVCSPVPLATLPGLLTCASLLFGCASSPSLLARASYNFAQSAHPCEFTFLLRKFSEATRSCLLQPCLACSPEQVYFSASQVRQSLLACASYNLAGSAHPCQFTFLLPKFAESASSCLLQPCLVCSPVRVYFSASQVLRACSLMPIATLPGLLTRASLLFYFPRSPSLLARATCNLACSPSLLGCASYILAGSAHPCEFTFLLRKFAEPARLSLIQSCRVCSPVRVYFSASQARRAYSLMPHTILPGQLTRASLIFLLRKFAEPARLCLIHSCRVCSPVGVYISTLQVRRASSLVPHTILPGLLTRASLLFCFANSPSLLACASYNLAGSAHPCEFTFLLRKFAEPARLCLIQSCRVCSPVRVYFSVSQVRRAYFLVPHTILPGQLTRTSLFFLLRKFAEPARLCLIHSCRIWSPVRVYFSASQIPRACSLVPHKILPGQLTRASLFFLLRKFAEPARSCILPPCRVCSPVRVSFSASQVRRACSLMHLAALSGLLTRASFLLRFASSPSLLAHASCRLVGSAHPCEFPSPLRKFAEPARSCILPPCRVCSPVRVSFSASQVRRACSLMHLAALSGLLTRASFLLRFASSPSLLAHASCRLVGSAHPCEFPSPLRKFAEPARSCILPPCRVCSPVRVSFSASQVRRACSLMHLAALSGLLTRASFLLRFASSPSLLAHASCRLVGSAHPCEFPSPLRKFAEPARSCILPPCRVCSPVRVSFSASQVRRACSLMHLAALSGLLTRASFLLRFASSPSLLAHASCRLVGSAHPCEFPSPLRKFAEPARSCILPPCRVCSPVRVSFSASQVRRACSLMHLAALSGLLTRASFLLRFASSPSLLAHASCRLVGSAHPCEFPSPLRKFAEPARSCILPPCRVCSPVRVSFSASQVRRACSLMHLAALSGLLTRASFLLRFASSPSLLAHASCRLVGSAHPCEFPSPLRKFAEPARSCILPPCRVCSPVRVSFSASQVRRACSLMHLAALSGLLTRASFLLRFASSPSLLAHASCRLVGSAHPCEFPSPLRKFAEPARSCILPPCRVCSPVRVSFSASQVRRACSLMHLAALSGLLTRASFLLRFASSPSLLAHASCRLVGSAHPCEFPSPLRKFAEPARSCILPPCRVCSPVRVSFSASQVRRACSLMHLAALSGLLTRASFLLRFASSPSLLAHASCRLVGSAHPCEFPSPLRKFAEPARSCILPPCRVCSPVRVSFSASQVRRACSLMHLAALSGLLTRASFLLRFASSPSLLAHASCRLVGSAHPCEFPSPLRKFAEPARSCILPPCRVCSPVRVSFSASQVRRACSLMHLAALSGLLTRASLLLCFASSPSLLACASYNLAGSAHPYEFTFLLRKFPEPAPLCLIKSCRVSSPVRVYFFCFASSPSLLACASYNLTGSAHPCEFTFLLRKFAEPARLCLIHSCRVCSPVRVYFFCFASSPSLLACASYILAGSGHPCEFTFLLPTFAESARSCHMQPCLVCSLVRVYFSTSQVHRVCSLVPLATLPGLLTCASLLFNFPSSPSTPSLLDCASYNLAGSAHPCEFTFQLPKFTEYARSCLLQPCPVCSPVRVYFSASQVCSPMRVYFPASQIRRACSLEPHTILPGLLTRGSLLFCFASSPSLLARASCHLARSAHPCEFTFLLRKFAEPARLSLIQSCRVCSPMRVYFPASQIRRACSLEPHTILPGLLTRGSLLFCFASSPSLLARASCHLARSAHPCEFTFLLRKFAEPARLSLIQSCRVCSPMRVYFPASQIRRACSLEPHTILPGLLTRGSLLFCFASSPSLLARASCHLARSAHPCEFTFLLRKFAEPARLSLIQSCRVCSPVGVYFSASQVRRACSLVPHTILPGQLTRASLFFLLRKFAEPARLCLIPSCRVCSPAGGYFSVSQVRRASSLVPHTILPGLLTRASLFFLLRKFAEPARLCLIPSCRVCSPAGGYFSVSQVRRASSLVPHTILPGLLTRASLLFFFANSPRLLACASYNLAGSAHPCAFTFLLRKFAEPARLCLVHSCR
ncbi:hypothetical protein CRG98_018323, partial [Punica granatum]